jgi:N-acetylglucosamine kinase-like BadF-type ATPase
MRIVVGVDGGASKTHALVVDETGRLLGFGRGGPSNHQVNGLDQSLGEIRQAVESAARQAGLAFEQIDTGCFCLAGADLPEDYRMLQAAIDGLGMARRALIKNDTMAALRAGLTRSWGVVVICGTGINAAGRAPDGTEIVLPGLGFISGDWGGGADLAPEMVRLAMRAWDGRGQPTQLGGLVMEALGAPSMEALLLKLYHGEVGERDLLGLVPLLFKAAAAGDTVAADLVVRMGVEVGDSANAIIRRLGLAAEEVEVVLGGSIFKGEGPLLVDTVRQVVHRCAPHAIIRAPQHEPVFGAALLALEADGGSVDEAVYRRLAEMLDGAPE